MTAPITQATHLESTNPDHLRSTDGNLGIENAMPETTLNLHPTNHPGANTSHNPPESDGDVVIEMSSVEGASQTTSRVDRNECSGNRRRTRTQRLRDWLRPLPEPQYVTEVSAPQLGDFPSGFPRLAAFQAADPNFSMYRGFAYLHSRLLLDLQDELAQLERELADVDLDDSELDPHRLRSREIDVSHALHDEGARNRRVILAEIKIKLTEYDDLLLRASKVRAFQKPSEKMYRMMRRFHYNTKPLMDAEMDAIRTKDDTITLRTGRTLASFDSSVETGVEIILSNIDRALQKLLRLQSPPFLRLLRTPELRRFTENQYVYFYSSSRVDRIVSGIVSVVILVLLVLPLISIYRLTHPYNDKSVVKSLIVLTAFALVFAAIMSTITMGTRYEIFAASAAYSALLLVFISGSNKE